jgi:uncharacterized membrane protein YuzA (DUF378 family)
MATTYSSSASSPVKTPERSLSIVDTVALVLLIVGGLNWGLVGILNFDLVAAIFGEMTTGSRIVYALVGLSALYSISLLFRRRA